MNKNIMNIRSTFDERMRQITETKFTYENIKEGIYPELTDKELEELCILYAKENKGNERYSEALLGDSNNINNFVSAIAELCIGVIGDDLFDTLEDIKSMAARSFVKSYHCIVSELYEREIFINRDARDSYHQEWDHNDEDVAYVY